MTPNMLRGITIQAGHTCTNNKHKGLSTLNDISTFPTQVTLSLPLTWKTFCFI
jgi:hypothetical protein